MNIHARNKIFATISILLQIVKFLDFSMRVAASLTFSFGLFGFLEYRVGALC